MAKAKKKDALSLEEKLERALVPVDEQPYEVPENWCWLYLGALLTEIKNGTTIKQDKSEEGYSVTRIESLQNQTIDFNRLGTIVDSNTIKETDWYQAGDIAMSHINSAEHVGKTAMITEDMLPLVHGMNLLRLRFNKCCLPRYFQYFTQSYQYKDEILKRINMAVNQVSINQKQVGTLEFPLPPLAEQQRIVEQIENLFSMLDEAKEKAQEALESISNRKSAILVNAFSGKLTEKWRNKKGYNIDSWESCKISDVFDLKAGKNISATKIVEEQDATHRYQCFGGNGVRGYVEEYNQDGDFCIIGRQGALCGNINVARGQFYATEHAVLVKYKKPVYLLWAEHYLRYMNLNQYATSVAQPGLAVGKINEVHMIYVPYEEQCEIGNNIESLFTKEDSVKANIEVVIEKIEILKKTILAKAFRGELGTNNPDEESSIALLKEMLEKN